MTRITYSSTANQDMTSIYQAFESALADLKSASEKAFATSVQNADLWLEKKCPYDSRLTVGRFKLTQANTLNDLFAKSKQAQRIFAEKPWQYRVSLCQKAAQLIQEQLPYLAAVVSFETGKNRLEALGEVQEAVDLFLYYAKQLEDAQGYIKPLAQLSAQESTQSILKPYGVFVVIAPFNFPFALAVGMSAAALLGGNSVILKPSEETPFSADALLKIMRQAGFDESLFQVIYAKGVEIAKQCVEHKACDGVAFTGSHPVGMSILQTLSKGRYPKPCLMEMGGKNPAFITASANLSHAVMGCFKSAFGLTGQKCSALSRLYIHEKIYTPFVTQLIKKTQTLVVGSPESAQSFMGPLISETALMRYIQTIDELRQDPLCSIVLGGQTQTHNAALQYGFFVSPTIVEVPMNHPILKKELFMPILALQKFTHLEQAIEHANDCDFGLTAGIFSQDKQEIDLFMNRIQAGVLYANRSAGATTGAWPGVQAFCGWKGSGSSGKGGCGPYYVSQFMREQSQTYVDD